METRVSTFLLELYRQARRMRHQTFQSWAFAELRGLVHFDSAFWYRWSTGPGASPLHASYLFQQPQTLLEEYFSRELWREDVVYHRAVTAPAGTAIYASRDDYTSESMRDFLRRFNQEQVLTIAYFQEIPQIAAGISLYRSAQSRPYDGVDASTVELVGAHFIDAWRENWLAELLRSASSRGQLPEFSLAVLMPDGIMSEAQDNFGRLMHSEWPKWHGPWMPKAVTEHFARQSAPWKGDAITIYQRVQEDSTKLILVRHAHLLDTLAPRKRSVAVLVAQGVSQAEIATRLSISPSTVNNYLSEVYDHLDVHDKVLLSNIVTALEP